MKEFPVEHTFPSTIEITKKTILLGFFVEYIFNCILQPWPDGLYLCFISDQGWNTDFITSMAYIDPVSFVILLTYQLLGAGWIFLVGKRWKLSR